MATKVKGGQTGSRPRLVQKPEEWQEAAACRTADSSVFFHPAGERGNQHDAREAAAKRICAECPVMAECGQAALARREQYGVWGGMTEDERRKILGQRRPGGRRPAAARLEVAA